MKKNNKINKIVILSLIGLIFVVSLVIFILNYTKDSSSFSLREKSWISNNINNIIDVSVYNDVPIYGHTGEGIIFSYLEEFTKAYGIEFNKVSYLLDNKNNLKDVSFRILGLNETVTDNDIVIYTDYYVIVAKDVSSLNNISNLSNTSIGILDNDMNSVKYYLSNASNVKYISCSNIDEMINMINSNQIKYMVIPNNLYLDEILKNDLRIVYHMDELYNKYVLTVNKNNLLKSIMNKFYMIYSNDYYDDKYQTYFLNSFFKNKGISEAERMNYYASNYVYGYVVNMPFENMVNKEFVGTISNYLSEFEDLVKVDFKIVGYPTVMELKQALSRGEIDLIFENFNTTGINVDLLKTISPFEEEYVIISKENYPANSIRSLQGKTIYTVNNTYNYEYLTQNGVTPKGFNNTDDLLRNIASDSIVMLDVDTYEYYKDKKFRNYRIIYRDVLDKNYSFAIRDVNKNNTFYELFSYYISSVNYKKIRYDYNTDYIMNSKNQLSNMIKCVLIILLVVVLAIFGLFTVLKMKKKKNELNKEDKLKFIDVMTSLKNRNYLNYNVKNWEDNVIYPQAILIIDLNNIKYINDNYGHAEGDEVIKKAASILIVNQEENTDIVRTDGNEFLIYMVGYDEKKVIEYTRKLNKELKNLPHEFGATIGYSMILDDIKTIDDAINEATLSMRQAKEKL